jgi:hypothetical protein
MYRFVSIAQRGKSLAELTRAVARSNELQEALWQEAQAMAAKDNQASTGLFIQALNDMIDNQGKRLSALRNRIPSSVLLTLFSIAAVAGAFAGYASGRDVQRSRLPVYVIGLLVSAVIYLIIDLDRPSAGFIINNQQPMVDLAKSIMAFPKGF